MRLTALLPTLLLGGLLALSVAGPTTAADDGPVVEMTLTPSR
jgi:hypothetical protein